MDTSTVSVKNSTFDLDVVEQKSFAAFVKEESTREKKLQTPRKLAGSLLGGGHCLTRKDLFRRMEQ